MSKPLPKHLREKRDAQAQQTAEWDAYKFGYDACYADMLPMVEMLESSLRKILPIAEAAFWDHHTAGTIPGSGYNHKAEHLAGQAFGWRSSEDWTRFKKTLDEALSAWQSFLSRSETEGEKK